MSAVSICVVVSLLHLHLLQIQSVQCHLRLRHFDQAAVKVFKEQSVFEQQPLVYLQQLNEVHHTINSELVLDGAALAQDNVVSLFGSVYYPLEVLQGDLIVQRNEECLILS